MKRLIAFLLACLMLVTMAACKKNDVDEPQPQDAEQLTAGEQAQQSAEPEEDDSDKLAVMGKEYTSLDEINSAIGGRLCRPTSYSIGIENIQLINENGVDIAQYYFVADDIPCGVRFSPDFKADISGAVKEDGTTLFADEEGEVTAMEHDGALVSRFITVDGQYVLVVGTTDRGFHDAMMNEIRGLATQDSDAEPEATE